MSTLTQFLGGSTPVGGSVIMDQSYVGINPTLSGQEYLLRGNLKAYASIYDPLLTVSKSYGSALINTQASSTWISSNAGAATISRIEYSSAGSKYYLFNCATASGAGGSTWGWYGYGASFTGTATTQWLQGNTYFSNEPWIFTDSQTFKTVAVLAAFYAAAPAGGIWYGNGGNMTNTGISTSFTAGERVWLAASPTKIIAIQQTTFTNGAQSSDGITWTFNSMTGLPTVGTDNVYRFTWCPVGNCFILVTDTKLIYTSTNGVAWTLRTTPSGMASVGVFNMQSNYCASSSTSTIIVTSYGQLLRTTDGINFTLVDLYSTIGALSPQSTSLYYTPMIVWDGSRYIMTNNSSVFANFTFTSTDGVSWLANYRLYNNIGRNPASGYTATGLRTYGITYTNSRLCLTSDSYPYDITGKIGAATPDYIGSSNGSVDLNPTYNYFLRIA